MRCPNCGTEITSPARFCMSCGQALVSPPPSGGGASAGPSSGSSPATSAAGTQRVESGAAKLLRDIRTLKFSVLFPIKSWSAERPWTFGSVQALAFLAFYPLLFGLIYQRLDLQDLTEQLKTSAWALGLYFAVTWGVILHRTVKPDRLDLHIIIGTFFFTAFIGVLMVPVLSNFPVLNLFYAVKRSTDTRLQWAGYVFGVGLVEESVKAFPAYFWFLIQKKPTTPREAAFVGVLSGLGFGVAEAIGYSIQYANYSSQGVLTPGAFLIIQFIRMITLPLLHALWAGVVGYFIGLAALSPTKKTALLIVGVLCGAIIHGTYDTFSQTWFGLILCLFSLLLFVMYVRSAERITEGLLAAAKTPIG